MTTYTFICENIDKTTRTYHGIAKKRNDLIGLPFPFTCPCIDGMFQEMYYWDTYFTNRGLIRIGRQEQAANNVRNFMYLLNTYGKIPNGNRGYYLRRSQPPFFGCMLEDLLCNGNNQIDLQEAFLALEKEYAFWQKKRSAPNGLNTYGCDETKRRLEQKQHVKGYANRTGIQLEYTALNSKNVLSECESGWDFSPRFSSECTSYNPVDLNCLLYKDEVLLSQWAKRLGEEKKAERYAKAAAERKERIITLMRVDGLYYDYNFQTGQCSKVLSCAGLFPFFAGIDDDAERYKKALKRLLREFGLVACDDTEGKYQWSAPNSWAPLNYVAFSAALRLGLLDEAKTIAQKYITAVDGLFKRTGQLWEKYNANNGKIDKKSEYGTPAMLGWSAGVYVEFYDYLNGKA